jgi:hypothetical protein
VNTQVSIGIIVAAVLVAGAWIWYERTHQPLAAAPLQEEFTWSFVDRGVASSTPKTDVALSIAGVPALQLGTYDGECFAVAGSQWPLLTGELSAAICQWGTTGKEVGVFEQGSGLILKQGDVVGGDAQHPGSRSNFAPLQKQPTLK